MPKKKSGEHWVAVKPKPVRLGWGAGRVGTPPAMKPVKGQTPGWGHAQPYKPPKPTGIPLDSQGRIDLAQIAATRLNFMDQYNQQVTDLNHNYNQQVLRANENEPYTQRGILSDYAGRGMAHSTGFGDASGRETQLFNQNLSDLSYAHNYGLQDLETQRDAMRRNVLTQNLAVRQAAADRMAAQAGSLGMGTAKPMKQGKINIALGLKHG